MPIELFLPGADLTLLKTRRQDVYDGLVHWTSSKTNAPEARMLAVEAQTYEGAVAKANALFIARLWGDGLPLWPPTRERVDWILRGATLPRDHVIGKFPPRGGIATVEACAVALAMAGGRPEYLPILIAAVDAFLDPATVSAELQATSGAPFPVVIVSGPMAKHIRLNAGFGCLGPDPQNPAGASIGRALRQLQQNLGGAVPGIGTMAVWGAMRYTNAVFAEDEGGVPDGWKTHAEERHGYARGDNSISLVFATGATNIKRRGAGKETPEEDAVQGLHRIAGFMAAPHLHYTSGYEDGTPGLLLISRVVAEQLAENGWTKQAVRELLWEQSKIPMAKLRAAGGPGWIEISPGQVARDSVRLDPWPITSKPENIAIVVSGGGHSTHAFWMQSYSHGVFGRRVQVPEAFDELVDEAETERAASMADRP